MAIERHPLDFLDSIGARDEILEWTAGLWGRYQCGEVACGEWTRLLSREEEDGSYDPEDYSDVPDGRYQCPRCERQEAMWPCLTLTWVGA